MSAHADTSTRETTGTARAPDPALAEDASPAPADGATVDLVAPAPAAAEPRDDPGEPAPAEARRTPAPARDEEATPAVDLGRVAWLVTVLACLVAIAVLVLQGYFGYAGVTFAVAVSAAANLL
jgi:hypothetical protein